MPQRVAGYRETKEDATRHTAPHKMDRDHDHTYDHTILLDQQLRIHLCRATGKGHALAFMFRHVGRVAARSLTAGVSGTLRA